MHPLERLMLQLRHHPTFQGADWLWDRLRPLYDQLIRRTQRRGLRRLINGTDPLRLLPQFRQMSETYEPAVWAAVMGALQSGDVVADVGAFIGLYTVAMGKRVTSRGKVVAFEPNPASFALLRAHVELNQLNDRVELAPFALGADEGTVLLAPNRVSMAAITHETDEETVRVQCVRLDRFWGDRRLDLLKLDVEGHEEQVLRGATGLLARRERPRTIFIEVHPYAWGRLGTSSDTLLGLLVEHGYEVTHVDGRPVHIIDDYGEVIARAV